MTAPKHLVLFEGVILADEQDSKFGLWQELCFLKLLCPNALAAATPGDTEGAKAVI